MIPARGYFTPNTSEVKYDASPSHNETMYLNTVSDLLKFAIREAKSLYPSVEKLEVQLLSLPK